MMLHFAYGANMSRAVMARYAPTAKPLGCAVLEGYRFMISADGYATVEPAQGQSVHGVLWHIRPRDRVSLDAWENVAAGLYRAEMLQVMHFARHMRALVYRARPCGEGRAWPGYMDLVIAAALEWSLPEDYVRSLRRWRVARPRGADVRKLGDFA
jgi:gamma-glutamylcyclotransferase (GGCT)/AIG2-like uncharacterized protein YtfP